MNESEYRSYQSGNSGFGMAEVTGDWVQNVRNQEAYLRGQAAAQRPEVASSRPIHAAPTASLSSAVGTGGVSWEKALLWSVILVALGGAVFGASDNIDSKQRNPFVSAITAGGALWSLSTGISQSLEPDSEPNSWGKIATKGIIFTVALPYEAAAAVGGFAGNAAVSVISFGSYVLDHV